MPGSLLIELPFQCFLEIERDIDVAGFTFAQILTNDELHERNKWQIVKQRSVPLLEIHCKLWKHNKWNLSITTTSMMKFITCDSFSNVF